MANKTPNLSSLNFEASLKELEAIVQKMEGPELSLEQAMVQFEKGVNLARQCQQALRQAEQRVEELIAENENMIDKTE